MFYKGLKYIILKYGVAADSQNPGLPARPAANIANKFTFLRLTCAKLQNKFYICIELQY